MPSRLKESAVFAFSTAIGRLPSHWSFHEPPLKAIAQTLPSRLTIAAHSLLSKPPLLGPPLAFTALLSALASWSCVTGQLWAGPAGAGVCADVAPTPRHRAAVASATAFLRIRRSPNSGETGTSERGG